jgi:hypothetical protein
MHDTKYLKHASTRRAGRGAWMAALGALALVLAACGGGPDEEFAGRWSGATTITGSGSSLVFQSSLSLSVSDGLVRVSAFCPDGTGSIQIPGDGRSLSWTGDVACPIPVDGCPAAVLRYASATFDLSDGGGLTVTAAGAISGCGSPFSVRTTFIGTK